MRTFLNLLCGFTLLASSWLGVMYVVLHQPGYERGVSMSLIVIIQSLLTLALTTGTLSALWWRLLTVAGAHLGGRGGRLEHRHQPAFRGLRARHGRRVDAAGPSHSWTTRPIPPHTFVKSAPIRQLT